MLPLRYQAQLVGVISVAERVGAAPEPDARVQLRRLADQAAVALANARMLEQVRTLAYYDSLTGLPNRLSYKERLANALETASRRGSLVAAFFIDLDHFSRINDTLGHEAGDHLLQQVAARLRASCREREDEVAVARHALDPEVARLGGDEFTVIMPGLEDPEDAGKLARRILSSLAHPFRLGGREIFINASIGIAVHPYDGKDIETLLMHADTAMYKAKEQGGNSYQTYSRSMNATALQRLTLENALRRALEREEFEVHYQPIVDTASGAAGGGGGPRALAPSRARPAAAVGVHPPGGGERADRADRRMGDASGLHAKPGLAARRVPPHPGRGEPVQSSAHARDDRERRADTSGDRA